MKLKNIALALGLVVPLYLGKVHAQEQEKPITPQEVSQESIMSKYPKGYFYDGERFLERDIDEVKKAISELTDYLKVVESKIDDDSENKELQNRRLDAMTLLVHAYLCTGEENREKARIFAGKIFHLDPEYAKSDKMINLYSSRLQYKLEKSKFKEFLGKQPPGITSEYWFNSEAIEQYINPDTQDLDLTKLEGKVVLLDFWGIWCGPCVPKLPSLEQTWQDYKDKGLIIIGIHDGIQDGKRDISDIGELIKHKGVTFPVAVDEGKHWTSKTFRNYGIRAVPQEWLIDKKGNVRTSVSIEELLNE